MIGEILKKMPNTLLNHSIDHLCYGPLVFTCIGYTDKDFPHKYVFCVYGNYGDIYHVKGTSFPNVLAKIIFDPKNKSKYLIEIDSEHFCEPEIVAEVAQVLHSNWINQHG